MIIDGKSILVFGLGISGLSAIKALSRYNCDIILLDSRSEEDLKEQLSEIKDIELEKRLNGEDIDLSDIDMIIKSPGIPPNNHILMEGRKLDIEIITDLELASRLIDFSKTIIITGTNGKTTTTSLVNEILSKKYSNTNILGNIGKGVLDIVGYEDPINIIEASSFQLEDTKELKSKISVIINLSPDHLDWHGDFKGYMEAKFNLLKNQDESDFAILNYDDYNIRNNIKNINSNIIWFSTRSQLDKGIFIKDGKIVIKEDEEIKEVMYISETNLILENLLAAIGATYYFGMDIEDIRQAILNFNSLEHRMEYISEKSNIKFYNDSKGTNPEATVKALENIEGKKILIAGGYDKGADFSILSEKLKENVEMLILMGETSEKMKDSAMEYGFENIALVDSMNDAVKLAYENAKPGYNILLSPACASWGMYDNFEQRGKDFKDEVEKLKVKNYEEEKRK